LPSMNFVLIPGMWLPGSVWEPVTGHLTSFGHRATALTLPGQGDGDPSATLDDQLSAVVAAVDAAPGEAVVVGHSAAASLAWMAADRRPDTVVTVVLVGGFPEADGELYFGTFAPIDGLVPFPGWEPFEGPDAADLDQQQRAAFSAQVVAVPETVTHGTVKLTDPRRHEVPVVLVCPEFTPAEAREWIAMGELAATAEVEFVDINSGHWPMITRPVELAKILADIADRLANPLMADRHQSGDQTPKRA
jgi:pimeloyl-ACP methyl ester carboxylesterase